MNRSRRLHKAYTLVEILVVMSIVASLTTLGLFGISQLNRTSRDDLRKVKIVEIKDAIESYYRVRGRFPSPQPFGTDYVWVTSTELRVGNTTLNFPGHLERSATSQTTTDYTYYSYTIDWDGYRLCVQLENGTWYNIGTSPRTC